MSQFDRHTTSQYVEGLRKFLDFNKRGFLQAAGFVKNGQVLKGRLASYDPVALRNLENMVNQKAALAESRDTTIAQRYCIARDYKGFSDTHVGREMGVSRELARNWGLGTYKIKDTGKLAALLDVPHAWLVHGGEEHLPADSHIGVRVGQEARDYREMLFGKTNDLFESVPEHLQEQMQDEDVLRTYIEVAISTSAPLATAARRAGGRWQILHNQLYFAPWVMVQSTRRSDSPWAQEVELIIQEELERNSTVAAAWKELDRRCRELGYTPDQYPKAIALHKRLDAQRNRIDRFGLNMNDVIRESVAKHYHLFIQ